MPSQYNKSEIYNICLLVTSTFLMFARIIEVSRKHADDKDLCHNLFQHFINVHDMSLHYSMVERIRKGRGRGGGRLCIE